jgi:predicted ATPase
MENKPLNGFGLENFRVFKNKQFFEFKPITIITGANSSGKSSVIKGLKLLKANMPPFRWDLTLPSHLFVSNDKFGHFLGSYKQITNFENSDNDKICMGISVSLKMVNMKFIACLTFKPKKGNEENELSLDEFAIYRENDFIKKDPIVRITARNSTFERIQIDFLAFKKIMEEDFLKNLNEAFGKLNEYNKICKQDVKENDGLANTQEDNLDDVRNWFRRTGPLLESDPRDPESKARVGMIFNDEEYDYFFMGPNNDHGSSLYEYKKRYAQNIDRIAIYGINSINYFHKEKFLGQTLDQRIFQWLNEYNTRKPILPFYAIINGELVLDPNHDSFKNNPYIYTKLSEFIESLKKDFAKDMNVKESKVFNSKLIKHFRKLEDEHFSNIKHLWFPYQYRHHDQPIQNNLRGWDGLVSENKDESEFDFDFWKTPDITKKTLEEDPDFGDYYKIQIYRSLKPAHTLKYSGDPYSNFRIFNIFIEQCIEKWLVQSKHKLESVLFVSHSPENPSRVYSSQHGSIFRIFSNFLQTQNLKRKNCQFTHRNFVIKHLKALAIADDLIIESIDGGAVLQPFFIIDKVKRSVADTGYGYMKVLMLLLNIVNAENNSSIVIEEPEANLHPDFQSRLSDIFIDAHKSFGHNFVIETHSEYLIRKLQYLSATGSFNNDDIVVYYLNHPKSKHRKQVNTVKIRLDGRLEGDFGHGFFDEASNLITDLFRLSEDN